MSLQKTSKENYLYQVIVIKIKTFKTNKMGTKGFFGGGFISPRQWLPLINDILFCYLT